MPSTPKKRKRGGGSSPGQKRPAARLSPTDDPVIAEAKPRARELHGLTPLRIQVFLETLAETGSTYAAAEAATPWARSHGGGLEAFRQLAKRDDAFKLQWEQAENAALAKVEGEITRRAMMPARKAILSQGMFVTYPDTHPERQCACGHLRREHAKGSSYCTSGCGCASFEPNDLPQYVEERTYDNTLLLKLAKKLSPQGWGDAQKVEHSGAIDSSVAVDLSKLSPEELDMITKLAEGQLARQAGASVVVNVNTSGEPDEGDDDEGEPEPN